MVMLENFLETLVWICTRDYIIYTLINQSLLRAGTDRHVVRKCELLTTKLDKDIKSLSTSGGDGQAIKRFAEIENQIDDLDVEKELLLISCPQLNLAIEDSRNILQLTDPFSEDPVAHPAQRIIHLKAYWGITDAKFAQPSEILRNIRRDLRSNYLMRVLRSFRAIWN